MAGDSWTKDDGRIWWRLEPRVAATVCLVLLWVAIRVAVGAQAASGLCHRTLACAPDFGVGWWVALLLASVYLVRLWPLAAVVSAVTFALGDGWWSHNVSGNGVARPVLELVYAVACTVHMIYLYVAWNRQRTYAFSRTTRAAGEPIAATTRPRWAILISVGAIVGATLTSVPVVFLMNVVDFSDQAAIASVWSTLAIVGLLVGALVGWRREHRRLRAVKTPGPALSVEASPGLNRWVHIYAPGAQRPFARYQATSEPQAARALANIGDVYSGLLYGDLRTGGFATFTSDDLTFPPRSPLTGPDSMAPEAAQYNPRDVREAPAPEATAETLVTTGSFNKTTTQYIVAPNEITRSTSSARRPTSTDSIPLDAVRKVSLSSGGRNSGDRLVIVSDETTYVIPRVADVNFGYILGERLRQHHRQDVATDDKTRVYLGLVGHGPYRQGRP